jgi:predicted porin
MRNTFVGLSGGFGTVVIGRHDTPYKLSTVKYNLFADTIADYAATRLDGVSLITGHARADNAIAYISPNMTGLTFAVAAVTSTDQLDAGDSVDAVSLSAGYANGPLTIDAAYEKIGDAVATNEDRKAWKLGAGFTFGDAKLGVVYEDVNDDAAVERDSLFLVGSYTMGAIVLKGQYGKVDAGATDPKAWALGADYNLSKRSSLFVVYGNGDLDNNAVDVSGWNIGMTHNF